MEERNWKSEMGNSGMGYVDGSTFLGHLLNDLDTPTPTIFAYVGETKGLGDALRRVRSG